MFLRPFHIPKKKFKKKKSYLLCIVTCGALASRCELPQVSRGMFPLWEGGGGGVELPTAFITFSSPLPWRRKLPSKSTEMPTWKLLVCAKINILFVNDSPDIL